MRFEDLPMDIIQEILERLPTRDAVRTGSICTSWRSQWSRLLPNIVLDRSHPPIAVDKILESHSSPLTLFALETEHYDHVDRWIVALSQRAESLRDLYLFFVGAEFSYSLHPSLFYEQFCNLKTIYIINCSIPFLSLEALPVFPHLTDLELRSVQFVEEGQLSRLLSGCLKVERVLLAKLHTVGFLEVHNPYLKVFKIRTQELTGLRFVARISVRKMKIMIGAGEVVLELEDLFREVTCTRSLQLGLLTIRALARGQVTYSLPSEIFMDLEKLKLGLSLINTREINIMMHMLRSSPNINFLKLYGFFPDRDNYKEDEAGPGYAFWLSQGCTDILSHVEHVEVFWFHFQVPEMNFLRFILGSTRSLRMLRIVGSVSSKMRKESALLELNTFKKASTLVEIIVED